MALRPCSLCHRVFRGSALHVYPALVQGGESERSHLRLCPSCFDDTTDEWTPFLVSDQADADGGQSPQTCLGCLAPLGDNAIWQFFLTAYSADDECLHYWGALHADCSSAIRIRYALG